MKSSTLHRAGLTREKMSLIENVKPKLYSQVYSFSPHNKPQQKKPELDVLWRDLEKSVQSKTKQKTPVFYLAAGFVAGLICAFVVSFIVFASTYSGIKDNESFQEDKGVQIETQLSNKTKAPSSISPSSTREEETVDLQGLEEKYTIKSGDTLDGIAYRYYGKYDPDKIRKIMEVNNIKNETSLQIGQVIIIPLY